MILPIIIHATFGMMFVILAFTTDSGAAAALFGMSAGINIGATVLHAGRREERTS